MASEHEVAAAWLQHSRTRWALDAVDELIEPASDGEGAWSFITALIAQAEENDLELEIIGAGPMERFVKRHGPAAIERIEEMAARESKFRTALGCVWIEENYHPPAITARLVAASGGLLKPSGMIGRPVDA